MRTVYVYLPDTMADWELGYIMAELNSKRFFKKDVPEIEIKTVGVTNAAIHSMGGLTIVPDCTINEVAVDKDHVLILPGADSWNDPVHSAILQKAEEFLQKGALVAAICGATTALAERGLLDQRKHTSNGVGFLDMMCPSYKGKASYINEPAIRDGNLITAAGTGSLLMAKLILEYLQVFKPETLEYWYEYFGTGNAESFFALMQSIQ